MRLVTVMVMVMVMVMMMVMMMMVMVVRDDELMHKYPLGHSFLTQMGSPGETLWPTI